MPQETKAITIDKVLSDRIDAIERKSEQRNPFYRDVPTMISVAAFVVSFGTTVVSYQRSSEQNVHALRSELALTLQKIAALPKENAEAFEKYNSEPATFASLSGYINQENLILSKEADDIIKKLPVDQISSTDLWAVGLALQTSRIFDAAMIDFKKALQVASTLDDEVSTLRYLGNLQIVTGRLQEGRSTFQQALEVFVKYQGFDDYTVKSTEFLTEMSWAFAERSIGEVGVAGIHLASAAKIVSLLPAGPQTEVFKAQLSQSQANLPPNGLPTQTIAMPAPGSANLLPNAPR